MNKYILLVGRIQGGEFHWDVNVPPPPEPEPVDGTLQDCIDIANADAMADEWRDNWLEEEFNRGGM